MTSQRTRKRTKGGIILNNINWNELREEYIRGGITQGELAERYGISAGSLRRRAAAEGWCAMRRSRESGSQEDAAAVSARVSRHLALTDRVLEIIARALEDEEELYRHVEFVKSSSGSEFICERQQAIDEERTGRIVKIMGELFEQQRMILGIHEYKDELTAAKLEQEERLAMSKLAQDERLTMSKLSQDERLTGNKLAQDERITESKLRCQTDLAQRQNVLAERKLELELLKLEGGTGGTDPGADGFLAALGLAGDDVIHEQP